ncbi:hypothetical protein AcV5_003292 [Taiwanofungus camphoratus]|nr:hypothetical protein AcV5_003292 [Antrodia cinnamomea]
MGPPPSPCPGPATSRPQQQSAVPTAPSPLLIQRWCVKEAPHPRPSGPSRTALHTYYASVSAQRGHRATRTRSSRVMGVLRSPLPSSAGLARPARKRNTRQTLEQDAGRRAHTPTLRAPSLSLDRVRCRNRHAKASMPLPHSTLNQPPLEFHAR